MRLRWTSFSPGGAAALLAALSLIVPIRREGITLRSGVAWRRDHRAKLGGNRPQRRDADAVRRRGGVDRRGGRDGECVVRRLLLGHQEPRSQSWNTPSGATE